MRLLDQLRERKLVQWSLAYVAAAFALLQGIDVVAQQFDWPVQVQRALTLTLVLGFFVMIILAWYHGERGAQTVSGTEATVLTVLVVVGGVLIWRLVAGMSSQSASQEPESAIATSAIRSIAVLPLDNYSGDSGQEYFAEGMTDQLTADLATISQLRVISRGSATQFRGAKRPSTPEIAKLLNVDAVIEGSVQRFEDRVRITVQLIDARQDNHLWAKSFDGKSRDVLALQEQMASAIADEIDTQLTPGEKSRLTSAPVVNPQAYDAYLQGRYFFNRPSDENLTKAIAQFQRAVELDPEFAPAYAGLSDAYLWAGFNETVMTSAQARPSAEEFVKRAVDLDERSAEARTSLAVFKAFYDYDFAGAEAEFRRAFALNSNYAYAHDQFGFVLALHGRFDESIEECQRAIDLDPLSQQIQIDTVFAFAFQGRYDEAMEHVARAAYIDAGFFYVPHTTGWVYLQEGKPSEAIPELEKATKMEGAPVFTIAWLGYAYGAAGNSAKARATLEEMKKVARNGYVPPFNLALIELGLGETQRALDYLEEAYAANSQWLLWLGRDRVFDPLRTQPRFVALMKRIGFADSITSRAQSTAR